MFGILLDEATREFQDVLTAFPKRRHSDGKDAETIEKILAKTSRGNLFLQIAVGCHDRAEIRSDDLTATDS